MVDDTVLSVQNLSVDYPLPRTQLLRKAGAFRAVDDVSFTLKAGRTLGLVGESGSGKSTIARAVMALETASAGKIDVCGKDLTSMNAVQLREFRSRFQMIFQDPYGSLDPRYTVARILAEPVRNSARGDMRANATRTLVSVGLSEADLDKFPHQFSGGQRQRIAIARALITAPALIVADEPVSALDVSVQAQVLNLMKNLQAESGVSYLFIGHDLAVVDYLCDDVIVLNRGKIVEAGPVRQVLGDPQHPYTQELLDAMPRLGVRRRKRAIQL
jgi:peptide/nickel transport system ATP-binding protein